MNDGSVLGVVTLGVEVAELVDAGEGVGCVGVVHDGATLEVFDIKDFFFEVDGTPGEVTFGVVEVAVYGAGVDNGDLSENLGAGVLVALFEEVGIEVNFDVGVGCHTLKPGGVAIDGQAFVLVVEVAVVVVVAHGQAGNDGRG